MDEDQLELQQGAAEEEGEELGRNILPINVMGEEIRVEDIGHLNFGVRPVVARNFIDIIDGRNVLEVEVGGGEEEEGLVYLPPQTPPPVDRKRKVY